MGLTDIPVCYYVIAVVGFLVLIWRTGNWALSLLIPYAFFVLACTVLTRKPYEGTHFQPELFWSYGEWKKQSEQVLFNVIMFIPIGFLAGRLWGWKGILAGLCLSALVEILQLVSLRGLCEFDDLFHNGLGACIGYAVERILNEEKYTR